MVRKQKFVGVWRKREKRASDPSLLQDQDVWELQLAVLLPKQAEFAVVFETEIKMSTNSFNG